MELKLEFVTGQDKDGEDIVEVKTFVTNKIKARLVVKALELRQEILTAEFGPDALHSLADFTCEVYKGKFTRDELYDGLESDLLIPTLRGTMERVIDGVVSRLDTFPPKQRNGRKANPK